MYPLEMGLAQQLAAGKPIEGVTPEVIAEINAKHAREFDRVTPEQALELLRKNSAEAAGGHPCAVRCAARPGGDGFLQLGRAPDVPVLARGPSGAAQLPPSGAREGGAAGVAAGRVAEFGWAEGAVRR
jgi:hypothetical protein